MAIGSIFGNSQSTTTINQTDTDSSEKAELKSNIAEANREVNNLNAQADDNNQKGMLSQLFDPLGITGGQERMDSKSENNLARADEARDRKEGYQQQLNDLENSQREDQLATYFEADWNSRYS